MGLSIKVQSQNCNLCRNLRLKDFMLSLRVFALTPSQTTHKKQVPGHSVRDRLVCDLRISSSVTLKVVVDLDVGRT